MLSQLTISNFALIKQLELKFNDDFTVLTGETGAGKSILLGALKLVLGERADIKSLGDLDDKCVVEAHFDISDLNLNYIFDENDLDYDDYTILRREILPSGKSRAFINDVPSRLSMLNLLGKHLVDIHSQFQNTEVLNQDFQFNWIDSFAGNHDNLLSFQSELNEYKKAQSELDSIKNKIIEFQKEKDFLTYQYNELENIDFENINISDLESELNQLENAETTLENLSELSSLLEDEQLGLYSVLDNLGAKVKHITEILNQNDLLDRFNSLNIEARDLGDSLLSFSDEIEINPQRLLEVQDSLNQLNMLMQKHSVQELNELLEIRKSLETKLKDDLNHNERVKELESFLSKSIKELESKGLKISDKRKKISINIEKDLKSTLAQLGIPQAEIKFEFKKSKEFNLYGLDELNLLFSANKGQELKPIEKAISGGEMSRLMLAIKKSVASHSALPTLILDEIDTGISGKIAEEVGYIMEEMGSDMQLISITHLPQVASKGKFHFKVEKTTEKDISITSVKELSKEERISEIAQMLSGSEVTEAAKQQARQLLKS